MGMASAAASCAPQLQRWLEQQVRALAARQEAEARVQRLTARRTELLARKESLAAPSRSGGFGTTGKQNRLQDEVVGEEGGEAVEEAVDSVDAELAYVVEELLGARRVLARAEGGALELRRRIAGMPVSDVRKVLGGALEALSWVHSTAAAAAAVEAAANAAASSDGHPLSVAAASEGRLTGSSEGVPVAGGGAAASTAGGGIAVQGAGPAAKKQMHSREDAGARTARHQPGGVQQGTVAAAAEEMVAIDVQHEGRVSVSSWDSDTDSSMEVPPALTEAKEDVAGTGGCKIADKKEQDGEEEEEYGVHMPQPQPLQRDAQSRPTPITPTRITVPEPPLECARVAGVWASPSLSPAPSAGTPALQQQAHPQSPGMVSTAAAAATTCASPAPLRSPGPTPSESPGLRASAASLSAALSSYKAHMRLTAASPLKLGVSPWQATVSPQKIAQLKSIARQRGLLGPAAGLEQ